MFRKISKTEERISAAPPAGMAEIIFRVYDEKGRPRHTFLSIDPTAGSDSAYALLKDPDAATSSVLLKEAMSSRRPMMMSLTYEDGRNKYLHVMPYERKWGKWRYACLQLTTSASGPRGGGAPHGVNALEENLVCLLLADEKHQIRTSSTRIPEPFGYTAESLPGKSMRDVFAPADLTMIASCSPDTNESILSCVFHCEDDGKRDVEVRKYSAADGLLLYVVCDVTRPNYNEEITQVTTRERRRIGQDLHDSIGQLLTGISLLSRSLANNLKRDEHAGDTDAAQISELADDASNQIRQISRGLMPTDIVHRGLSVSLKDLARVTTESCGLSCKAMVDESLEFSDGAVETHLFRIAQEAVNNAVRHSGGDRVDVELSEVNGMPQLMVRDNGAWRNIMENSGGIGLKTMQYRATVINGQLNIQQNEDGGTAVVCRLEAEDLFETKVMQP